MGKRNERLERLVAGSRGLLRPIHIAGAGLREDPVPLSGIAAKMLTAIQDAEHDFTELLADVHGGSIRPVHGPDLPTELPPRRRGAGRAKRLPAAGENHQVGAAEEVADQVS